MGLFQCPCCEYFTLNSISQNDICPVCFWEDDWHQKKFPDDEDGPNHISLNQARKNYAEYGVCEKQFIDNVRKPFHDEKSTC